MLSQKEIQKQSEAAMRQWEPTWRKNSKQSGELFRKLGSRSHKELLFASAGKSILCIGLGPSLEDKIDILREHQDNPAFDILCVDKAFGLLVENGIKPENIKYVNIADAGISYEKWLKPYVQHTRDTILIANINANPEWAKNWWFNPDKHNIYFYCNKDNIHTEKIFLPIAGIPESDIIPAGSNVGNSNVIFASSILGGDEILLLGYDFAWRFEQNYYAFADNEEIGTNKRGWMRHVMLFDKQGEITNTSNNLMFSSRWLSDYYNVELRRNGVKLIDCSGSSILEGVPRGRLESKLKNAKIRKLDDQQKNIVFNSIIRHRVITPAEGPKVLEDIVKENKVVDVTAKYITPEQDAWLQAL
jgi:hypothetical protein